MTTIQFTETLVAYDNPFESRITIVDADTNDTVAQYVNWDAASVWFAATRRPVPSVIPVWALPADTRYVKGACE